MMRPPAAGSIHRQFNVKNFAVGLAFFLLATLVGASVVTDGAASSEVILDSNQNVDKPVSEIADSDPLYGCVDSTIQDRNSTGSNLCNPQDSVVLPDAELENTDLETSPTDTEEGISRCE